MRGHFDDVATACRLRDREKWRVGKETLDPAKAGEEEFGVGLGVLEVGDEDFHGFRGGELGELTSELGHAFLLVRVEE